LLETCPKYRWFALSELLIEVSKVEKKFATKSAPAKAPAKPAAKAPAKPAAKAPAKPAPKAPVKPAPKSSPRGR
jgi:hypothetical protein